MSAQSSNQALVPAGGIVLGGSGAQRSLMITPAANRSGSATITLTVSDGSLTTSNSMLITVAPVNDLPTLDPLDDLTIAAGAGVQTVTLRGIDDGDPDRVQTTTVTAASSNPALIPAPSVEYQSPNGSGLLRFAPTAGAAGRATISVLVTDSAGGVVERQFTVTVTGGKPSELNESTIFLPLLAGEGRSAALATSMSASGTPVMSMITWTAR